MFHGNFLPKTDEDYKNETRRISETCTVCKKTREAVIKTADLFKYNQGEFVQVAFPTMSASDREFFFLSNMCGECWDELMADDDEDEEGRG